MKLYMWLEALGSSAEERSQLTPQDARRSIASPHEFFMRKHHPVFSELTQAE